MAEDDKNDNGLMVGVGWGVVIALLIGLVIAILADLCDCSALAKAGAYFERFSAFIRVIDDLIVRIAGVFVTVVGAVGMVFYTVRSLSGSKEHQEKALSWRTVVGTGAGMVIGGAAFAAANFLDTGDSDAEKLLAGPAAGKAIAGWVQAVPADPSCKGTDCRPRFEARTIVTAGRQCPAVTAYAPDGREQSIKTRLRDWKTQGDWNEWFEEINVCRAELKGQPVYRSVKIDGLPSISLSKELGPEGGLTKIVLIGDTGCRGEVKDQNCRKAAEWPLREVSRAVAESGPELIVHLGDYLYSNEDLEPVGEPKTDVADTWAAWRRRFFEPAREMLQAAPLIMVRGNHEACNSYSHSHYGFGLFFGWEDEPYDCRENPGVTQRTHAIDIGEDLRLIIADTSSVRAANPFDVLNKNCGKNGAKLAKADDVNACKAAEDLWAEIAGLTRPDGPRRQWVVTHVPLFGVEETDAEIGDNKEEVMVRVIPQTTSAWLAAWNGLPEDKGAKPEIRAAVQAIVSADRHHFQTARRDGDPVQISSGAGGVQLDPVPHGVTEPCTGPAHAKTSPPSIGLKAGQPFGKNAPPDGAWTDGWTLCTNKAFGYVLADPTQSADIDVFKFMKVRSAPE